jgi:transposase
MLIPSGYLPTCHQTPGFLALSMRTGWRRLFGGPQRARPTVLPMPDFAELHQQRQRHPHLTQQLLWEEYRQANPSAYRYSRFCKLFQRWRRKQDIVPRQEHKAGEKLFVDWAGTIIAIYDPNGGPIQQALVFFGVLAASSYTYAKATSDEQLASWICLHVRAFEFYYGVPKLSHRIKGLRRALF